MCGYGSQVPRSIIQNDDLLCARITGSGTRFPVDLASHRSGGGSCFDADGGASCTASGGYSSYLRGDGVGDACDSCAGDGASDADGDLVCELDDNCPEEANAGQADGDEDGVGDACDNCVGTPNRAQVDTDEDGLGDACDGDDDDDGVSDEADNCPLAPNADQADGDSDDFGDVCDNCPQDANPALNSGLDDLLGALDTGYADLTDLVPNRYDFSEGESGTYISDGGDDMYDGGNSLNTNLASAIPYTNNTIVASDSQFGPGSEYFTAKYPGLFFLAVSNLGVDSFSITGNNGADGSGSVDGTVLGTTVGGTQFTAFVKRVFGTPDPSINHIVIVPGDGTGVSHSYSSNTDDDLHTVTGLAGIPELYYVLVARQSGAKLSDADAQAILDALAPDLLGGQADSDGDGEGDVCDQCPTLDGTGACDDGLFCTVGDTCGGGSCNATPRVCDDSSLCTSDSCSEGLNSCVFTSIAAGCVDADPCTQDSCVPSTGCVHAAEPAPTCLAPAKANFQVSDSADDAKDKLKWSWNKGPELVQSDFGSPNAATRYTLCVYDTVGGTSSIAARLEVDPGSNWTSRDPKGWNYKDKTGASDGVVKVQLGSGAAGRSKIKLQAKGAAIPMPMPLSATEFFDLSPTVTVQLHNDENSVCWSSEFSTASKNVANKFAAKF